MVINNVRDKNFKHLNSQAPTTTQTLIILRSEDDLDFYPNIHRNRPATHNVRDIYFVILSRNKDKALLKIKKK